MAYLPNTSSDFATLSARQIQTLHDMKHTVDMGTIHSEYAMYGIDGLITTCKIFGVSVRYACEYIGIKYPLDEVFPFHKVVVGDTPNTSSTNIETPDKIVTDPKTGLLTWVNDK